MKRKFKRKIRDIFYSNDFDIAFGCVLKHLEGFFYKISLYGDIKFRAINYIPSFIERKFKC